MPMRGKFITMEGSDGAGKSTQIALLMEYFERENIPMLLTREPGGTPIGEKIRTIILDTQNREMTDMTEALLYAAGRMQHVEEKLLPALTAGMNVLCDRYVDSSIVYQGFGRGLGQDKILAVNAPAIEKLMPDITIFLDLSPEKGILRKKGERKLDRLEEQALDFHRRTYEGYQWLAKTYPERIHAVDADADPETVHQRVLQVLLPLLKG